MAHSFPQVLFRNNCALSRDITGLFQSFQSSSAVLDPATNPSLFQSTLVIIIKVSFTTALLLDSTSFSVNQDVIQSDAKEITKEYELLLL